MSTSSTSWLRQTSASAGLGVMILLASLGLTTGTTVAQEAECWTSEPSMETGYPQWPEPPRMVIDPARSYVATLDTNRGDIVVELNAADAPNTVNNFVCLALAGYYEVTVFHRIIADFMVQGGDPTGTGTGGPGYQFEDELPEGETPYVRGTLAMANAGPNTNGSQFFIVRNDQPAGFTPNYSIFGRVTEGLEVLDTIAQAPVGPNPSTGEPSSPDVTLGIAAITIEEDGQPMGALDAADASAPASPGAGSATTAGQADTGTVESTGADAPVAVADENDSSMTLWIAGGAGVLAIVAAAYGLFRRSRGPGGAGAGQPAE